LLPVNLHRTSLLKAVAVTVLFGSVPACIRVMEMDSFALGNWRLGLSAVGMTLILLARGWTWPAILAALQRNWRPLAAMGLFFGLHWLTYFLSIKWASASIVALSFSTCGVQMPLLGWAMGLGRPSVLAMLGVALAMGGSVMCLPEYEAGDYMIAGMAIGILSGTLYAMLPILHQRHARLDHDVRTWAQFVFALPVFLATAPLANWSLSLFDFLLVLHPAFW
jgi:drug/metabolite transporter (DMT)-like permease